MKKKGKNYVVGAVVLTIGSLLSKFLGMFFRIPLVNYLGDYGMGLYGYAYPLYTTFLMVSTAGLPSAVSKMVSESVSRGNYKQAYKIFNIAFIALAVMGGLSSIIMFAGANFFINIFEWDPEAYYSIIAISFAPFFVCLISVVRGFFQGMQNMIYTSVSEVLEQIGRVFVGLFLAVYLMNTRGVAWGAAGATFGAVAGAVIAFLFLYVSFAVYRSKHSDVLRLQPDEIRVEESRRLFKTLVLIAVPIACGSIVTTLMDLINSMTITSGLKSIGYSAKEATNLYGQLTGKVQTLINVPLVIGSSLAVSLVPSISESFARKNIKTAQAKSTLAVRLSFFVSVPAALGLSLLSEPIFKLLYPDALKGYAMLSYLSYTVIFTVAMSTLQGILQGAGKYYAPLKNLLIGGAVKYILNVALIRIPALNIYGAIISSIAATFVIFIFDYKDVKKHVGFGKMMPSIIKILLSSFIMGLICIFSFQTLCDYMSEKIAVVAAIFISVLVYGASIIGTKAFTLDDLRSIRS